MLDRHDDDHSLGRGVTVLRVITFTYTKSRVTWTSHRSPAHTRSIFMAEVMLMTIQRRKSWFVQLIGVIRHHPTTHKSSRIILYSLLETFSIQRAFNAAGLHNLFHVVDGVRAQSTAHSTFGSIRCSCILGMIVIHCQVDVWRSSAGKGSNQKYTRAGAKRPSERKNGKRRRSSGLIFSDQPPNRFRDRGASAGLRAQLSLGMYPFAALSLLLVLACQGFAPLRPLRRPCADLITLLRVPCQLVTSLLI